MQVYEEQVSLRAEAEVEELGRPTSRPGAGGASTPAACCPLAAPKVPSQVLAAVNQAQQMENVEEK